MSLTWYFILLLTGVTSLKPLPRQQMRDVELLTAQLTQSGVTEEHDDAHEGDIEAALVRRLDGCMGVFIDAGANIGMHARFLFEPHLYNKSTYLTIFGTHFGTQRDHMCAVEFEPNPAHLPRLRKLSAAYAAHAWRVIVAPYGVNDARGNVTFFHNDGPKNKFQEWSFSMYPFNKNSRAVHVPTIDFARFLQLLNEQDEQAHSLLTQQEEHAQLASKKRRPVVVKMDIEGNEYNVLPHMIEMGVLCDAVDSITVEFHKWRTPPAPNQNRSQNVTKDSILNTIAKNGKSAVCRTKRINVMDDEAYLYDRNRQQLNDPRIEKS